MPVSSVQASYAMSYKIAKVMKPFVTGDFVKDCILTASEIVCPDKKQNFSNISLSQFHKGFATWLMILHTNCMKKYLLLNFSQ